MSTAGGGALRSGDQGVDGFILNPFTHQTSDVLYLSTCFVAQTNRRVI